MHGKILRKGEIIIKNQKNNIILIIILTFSSALIYFIQYLLFHQTETSVFYLLQDLAFVPIQVLIVTLIINRFLNLLEMQKKIKKINVIISTFFMESGTSILSALSKFNRINSENCNLIKIEELICKKNYQIKKIVEEYNYDIYADPERLDSLDKLMVENKGFMLNMLENSNLLEHDSFTDMLWAVFHVGDELRSRGDLRIIDKSDIDHLSNDIQRAYTALTIEWIYNMSYLHDEYPYLYSLAIRKNPFHR